MDFYPSIHTIINKIRGELLMLVMATDSKTFLKSLKEERFKKAVLNALVVVASDGLKVSGEYPDAILMSHIVPPATVIHKHVSGDILGFNRLYLKYLQSPQMSVILSTLLGNAATEGKNIIFLCNTTEDNFAYLELVTNYINMAYNIEAAPLKKVIKGKAGDYEADPDDVNRICQERFERAQSISPNVMEDVKAMMDTGKDKKKKKKK